MINQSANEQSRPVAFIFAGQGAHWHGMGKDLYAQCSAFRNAIHRLNEVLNAEAAQPSWELTIAFDGSCTTASELPQGPQWTLTVVTTLQIALVETLRSRNVHPGCVIGHSSGELAAASTAGHISIETAIVLAYRIGSVLERECRKGLMATCDAGQAQIETVIQHLGLMDSVAVAYVNSASITTVSGNIDAVEILRQRLLDSDVLCRKLRTDQVAYHSHHISEIGDALGSSVSNVDAGVFETRESSCAWLSTVDAGTRMYEAPHPSHWRRNLESVVDFAGAVSVLVMQGAAVDVVEVGPHSSLERPLRDIYDRHGRTKNVQYYPTQIRGQSGESLCCAIAVATGKAERM